MAHMTPQRMVDSSAQMLYFYGPVPREPWIEDWYEIDHGLGSDGILSVTLWRYSGHGKELVIAGVRVRNTNVIEIQFAATLGDAYEVGIVAAP